MSNVFDQLRRQVQADLDALHQGGSLELGRQEYPGPLTIRRSMTLEGHGATIWALTGPVLIVEAGAKVHLKNLRVEVTGEDMDMSPPEEVAIQVQPGGDLDLEDVEVRGKIDGLAMEAAGHWRYPKTLYLGQVSSSSEHGFRVRIATAAACRISSEVTGIEVTPTVLPGGPVELQLKVDRLRNDTFLYGRILLKTGLSKRWIVISGQVLDIPATTTSPSSPQTPLLWEPHDWGTLSTAPAPAPPAPMVQTPAPPAPTVPKPTIPTIPTPTIPTPTIPTPTVPTPTVPTPTVPTPTVPTPTIPTPTVPTPTVPTPTVPLAPISSAPAPSTSVPTVTTAAARPGLRHQDPAQLGIFQPKSSVPVNTGGAPVSPATTSGVPLTAPSPPAPVVAAAPPTTTAAGSPWLNQPLNISPAPAIASQNPPVPPGPAIAATPITVSPAPPASPANAPLNNPTIPAKPLINSLFTKPLSTPVSGLPKSNPSKTESPKAEPPSVPAPITPSPPDSGSNSNAPDQPAVKEPVQIPKWAQKSTPISPPPSPPS